MTAPEFEEAMDNIAMIKCPVDGCSVELRLRDVGAQVDHMNNGDEAHKALISKRLQGLEGRERN